MFKSQVFYAYTFTSCVCVLYVVCMAFEPFFKAKPGFGWKGRVFAKQPVQNQVLRLHCLQVRVCAFFKPRRSYRGRTPLRWRRLFFESRTVSGGPVARVLNPSSIGGVITGELKINVMDPETTPPPKKKDKPAASGL